jgi:hypothetical protein
MPRLFVVRLEESLSPVAFSTMDKAIWLESREDFRLAGFLALGRFGIRLVLQCFFGRGRPNVEDGDFRGDVDRFLGARGD